jgi:8-oxo-dGTP diphosphatase
MEKIRPKIAVNIFVIRDNKILLGMRKNTAGDGDWGLPGGHLEFMEHLSEGAKRELEEETGLKTNDLSFLQMINDPRTEDNTHYLHVNFITKDFEGEPRLMEPDKCYEWKWFDLNSLPKNIFIGHRRCIPAFFDKVPFLD